MKGSQGCHFSERLPCACSETETDRQRAKERAGMQVNELKIVTNVHTLSTPRLMCSCEVLQAINLKLTELAGCQ